MHSDDHDSLVESASASKFQNGHTINKLCGYEPDSWAARCNKPVLALVVGVGVIDNKVLIYVLAMRAMRFGSPLATRLRSRSTTTPIFCQKMMKDIWCFPLTSHFLQSL